MSRHDQSEQQNASQGSLVVNFLLLHSAIEAIKNAHQAELQKEIQKRRLSEDMQLEDIHRYHRHIPPPLLLMDVMLI